jgi:aryl-alcohol dehydrogenase-like predicted oxidoreductase
LEYTPLNPIPETVRPLDASPSQSEVAAELDATPMAVAQAWLLHRSPNILLIPGTSSVAHLRENLAAASLTLPAEILRKLDEVGAQASVQH